MPERHRRWYVKRVEEFIRAHEGREFKCQFLFPSGRLALDPMAEAIRCQNQTHGSVILDTSRAPARCRVVSAPETVPSIAGNPMESQSFELFGTSHLATLGVISAVALVVPLTVRRLAGDQARNVAYLLAVLLLGQEAIDLWRQIDAGNLTPAALLPLHLCTLAVYLTAWTLVTRSYRTYEVVYFWGLGGTIQALLTPDLTARFPDPTYLLFFAGHGLVIVGVMHVTIAFRLRPHAASIPRVAAITAAVAGIIFVINLWLDTNFLYLMAKPVQPSLLDWFGPWPWYLIGLVIVGLASLFVWYLPFLLLDLWRRRRAGLPVRPDDRQG